MLELAPMTSSDGLTIRGELRPGDLEAIARMHGRIYTAEHGVAPAFEQDVADALAAAVANGWPDRGGVRIVELDGELAGSMAWTVEGDHAKLRWVLLNPSLRGRGLGRSLLRDLLEEIDAAGHEVVVLDTFSALRTAAHLYREQGFVVVDSRPHVRWGPTVELQRYERRRGGSAHG
jgi:ribosomal protein S18 acetylase RimI-like enzyme